MTDMMKALRFGLVLALCPVSAFAQTHTKQVLTGYKCMMLAKQWAGEGPAPPPVPVYDGPSAGAKQIGIAGGTVIIPTLAQSINGRVSMVASMRESLNTPHRLSLGLLRLTPRRRVGP